MLQPQKNGHVTQIKGDILVRSKVIDSINYHNKKGFGIKIFAQIMEEINRKVNPTDPRKGLDSVINSIGAPIIRS